MAGDGQVPFFACLWTETKSRSINSQKERGQYSAILTEQTWSIKDLLYGFRGSFSCGIQRVVPSGHLLDMLTVYNIYSLHVLKFAHLWHKGLLPDVFRNTFEYASEVYSYNTRYATQKSYISHV